MADELSDLISPPPVLPRQGGGVLSSLPWREGLREGGKMAICINKEFEIDDQTNTSVIIGLIFLIFQK
jgi:hypothetical protein